MVENFGSSARTPVATVYIPPESPGLTEEVEARLALEDRPRRARRMAQHHAGGPLVRPHQHPVGFFMLEDLTPSPHITVFFWW